MNNRNVEYTDKSESLFTAIRKPTPCPTAFSNYNVAKMYIFLFGYRSYSTNMETF